MEERIRKSILVILAAVALIATISCIYSAEYVGGLACAVVLASVVVDLADPKQKQKQTAEFTKDDEKAIEDAANAVVMLCAYNIPKKVIEYYHENYPYLVVAEKPTSTEVEYWWAGDKEANDLIHSRVADKYKQLGHYVIANAVKGEAHG